MHDSDLTAQPLMDRLKESTKSMHDSAESSQFQSKLANAHLAPEVYADYLEQLYLIHSKLEEEIRSHQGKEKPWAEIVTKQQLQEQFLKDDLDHFGRRADNIKALAATRNLLNKIEQLSQSCPVALLGMHYVLLGSKHGGKFIAKNCQQAYQLSDGQGVIYFDPYGQTFMSIWKTFKEEMNKLALDENQSKQICDAAASMFLAVGQIGNELMLSAKI